MFALYCELNLILYKSLNTPVQYLTNVCFLLLKVKQGGLIFVLFHCIYKCLTYTRVSCEVELCLFAYPNSP